MRIDSPFKADHSVLQASSKVGSVFAILSDLPGRVDWTKLAGCARSGSSPKAADRALSLQANGSFVS
jgi:hypothetical protein